MSRVIPFGFGGYRSFGPEAQLIPVSPGVNLIAGPNNCGKSNILHFIKHLYNAAVRGLPKTPGSEQEHYNIPDGDLHRGGDGVRQFAVGLEVGGQDYNDLVESLSENPRFSQRSQEIVDTLFGLPSLGPAGHAWFTFVATQDQDRLTPTYLDEVADDESLTDLEWGAVCSALGHDPSGNRNMLVNAALAKLCPSPDQIDVEIVPAFREVNTGSAAFGGSGLFKRLHVLQNPRLEDYKDREKFPEITRFVQEVLRTPSATLSVPHDDSTINVNIDGKELPLESLGSGIHQVIMLAVAATVPSDQVVCIEEPELHVHPILQRLLIKYLSESTDNQYFITTHSASILDADLGPIHQVSLREGKTRVDPVRNAQEQFEVCRMLGYRASDFLQANSIIWVEGPSDRLYVRHWLESVNPDLIEGIHFSIMFYGGSLLAHLEVDDSEVTEFISLARINRHVAVLMDSDRSKSRDRINATKKRVEQEVKDFDGFVWVTKGREIENYLSEDLLREKVKETTANASLPETIGAYGDVFANFKEGRGSRIDKMRLASAVCDTEADLTPLDLKRQVRLLAGFITKANGP